MVKYLVFCVFVTASYVVYTTFPVNHGPGITAEKEPTIQGITWQEPFQYKGATLTPKKQITAEVRVVKRKRYFFDTFSKYAPIDALVGWNELSDEKNLDYLYFTLGDRKSDLELTRPPLELSKIYTETDLWHMIPSTSRIDEKLKQLRNGNIIKVKGLLVDIYAEDMFDFETSTRIVKNINSKAFAVWIEELEVL